MKLLYIIALLLITPAHAHETHQHGQTVNYTNWVNALDKGCCNNMDCRPAKDDEVQYSPVVKVQSKRRGAK